MLRREEPLKGAKAGRSVIAYGCNNSVQSATKALSPRCLMYRPYKRAKAARELQDPPGFRSAFCRVRERFFRAADE